MQPEISIAARARAETRCHGVPDRNSTTLGIAIIIITMTTMTTIMTMMSTTTTMSMRMIMTTSAGGTVAWRRSSLLR
jgi:hypothetical protein